MSEILQSGWFTTAMLPVLGAVLLIFGVWVLDAIAPGSLPVHFDNNMNAAVIAAARLVAVSAVVFTALVAGSDSGLLDTAARGLNGLIIYVAVSVILSYAYRGAADVAQKTGPLLPCAVLVASAQIPAALISIASII